MPEEERLNSQEEKETLSEGVCKGTGTVTEVWKCEMTWLQESASLHGPYHEPQ